MPRAACLLPRPRLKSAPPEIKWNRPANCSLLFRALISRRRYRETFLAQPSVVRNPTWGETRSITFFLQASAWNSDKKSFTLIFAARRILSFCTLRPLTASRRSFVIVFSFFSFPLFFFHQSYNCSTYFSQLCLIVRTLELSNAKLSVKHRTRTRFNAIINSQLGR